MNGVEAAQRAASQHFRVNYHLTFGGWTPEDRRGSVLAFREIFEESRDRMAGRPFPRALRAYFRSRRVPASPSQVSLIVSAGAGRGQISRDSWHRATTMLGFLPAVSPVAVDTPLSLSPRAVSSP